MTDSPHLPSTSKIREFLRLVFNDEELTAFCFDNFREVSGNFSLGMTVSQKIQLLLDHCTRREKTPALLALLAEFRPDQFAQQFSVTTARLQFQHLVTNIEEALPRVDLRGNIVAILGAENRVVGTGFIVANRLILTCAHVSQIAGSVAGEKVKFRLHRDPSVHSAQVDVMCWRSPEAEDIALLRLEADLPISVPHLALDSAGGRDGNSFRSFGYPSIGQVDGIWATGKVEGLVHEQGRSLIQLTSQNLAQGISGAPILDESSQKVIGMVTSVYRADATSRHRDTGFAIPTETFWEACTELQRLTSQNP